MTDVPSDSAPLTAHGPTDDLVNPDPDTVTVWSDIGCPWATLALHTLRERAAETGRALRVDHRAFPLELFNRRPTPKPLLDLEVAALAGSLPVLGWRRWTAPESTYPVTTLPAMEAVQACKLDHIGGLAASDELDAALRRAFYEQGRCISVHPVILDVAAQCPHLDVDALAAALEEGVSRAAVYAQWRNARQPRVVGSPHLFTAAGADVHNPGATYHWSGSSEERQLHLDDYRTGWADDLLHSSKDGASARDTLL